MSDNFDDVTMDDVAQYIHATVDYVNEITKSVTAREELGDSRSLDKISMLTYDYFFKVGNIMGFDALEDVL